MNPEKKGWNWNNSNNHSLSAKKIFTITIGKKLFFGFGFILALLAAMAAGSYLLNREIIKDTHTIQNVETPLALMAEQIIGYDAILTSNTHWALLHAIKGNWNIVQEYQQKHDETEIKQDILLKHDARILLEQSMRPKEMKEQTNHYLQEMDKVNIALAGLEKEAFRKMNEKKPEEAYALIINEPYYTYKDKFYQLYQGWADTETELVGIYLQKNFKNTYKIKLVNIIFGIIAVTLGLVMSFTISRSITMPIKKITRATEEIERGNLSVRVSIQTGNELQELGNAFNNTAEALERLEEERKELDAAKTRLLSITSHELRSPMTPMKAHLQMLETGGVGKLTASQKESVSTILRNLDRLDKIMVDFLEISRMEAGRLKFDFKKTNLRESINRVAKFMKGFMPEKKIEIITKIPTLPIIEIDQDRFEQVLSNLINNAIKFSKPRGKIEISASLLKSQNKILFRVKDYGIGIIPENQSKIFEPFFQAEQTIYREHGGTGLGLAICRGIIESQNGKIWADSTPRKGSTFYFTLPLTPVTEIKPIRILFSTREIMEAEIQKVFMTILGPMGKIEFENLKKEKALIKNNIIKYITSLVKQKILAKETGNEFKQKITEITEQKKRQ